MVFLLDTHTLIWFIEGNDRLPVFTREIIENESNVCLVSIGTFWEIAIKVSIGTLKLHVPFHSYYELVMNNGIELKDLNFGHAVQLSQLPFHHRDPFDRMLIAQALSDDITLISNEKLFDEYGVKRIWN